MSWKFQPAVGLFEEVRKDWDALNRAQHNHILLDSRFVASLLRHFGSRDVVLGINLDSRLPAMAMLIRNSWLGWETFQPSQAPIGLITAGQRDESGEALHELRRGLPGLGLQLGIRQQDPDFTAFPRGVGHGEIEALDYIQTARLILQGEFDDYWQARGTNLKHNLARQRRRLAEEGRKLELITHRCPEAMAKCVKEYGQLESGGWKAHEGTAVAEGNSQGRFYREILETFSAHGEGVVFQLALDGKVVATDLCLKREGMLIVLKTTYEEKIERVSPALLMRQDIVRELFAEGQTRVIEFYGKVRDWHTKWTDQVRMMYHLNCFGHQWVASAKKLMKRFR